MAAKKEVATPARSIVPAMAAPVKAVSAHSVETTALIPVTIPVPNQVPAETEAVLEPAVALNFIVGTPAEITTDLPVGTPVVPLEIETLKTKGKSTMENAMKSTEEFVSFGQGNVEAVMKSSQIWATGLQDLSKSFAATAQASMDETMATVKALSSVKSLKEAMDIQSTLAKTAMEKLMAESGKLTDASMKLAEQAIAPLTARVTLAAEKFGRTA